MTSLEDLEFKAKNELLEMGDTFWEKDQQEHQQYTEDEDDSSQSKMLEQIQSNSSNKIHFWGLHSKQKSQVTTTTLAIQPITRKTSLVNLPEFGAHKKKLLMSSCSITRAVSPREKDEMNNKQVFTRKPCTFAYDPFNIESTKNNNNMKNLDGTNVNKDGIQLNNCNQYSFLKNPVMYYLRQKRRSINNFKTLQDMQQHEQNSLSRASKEIIKQQKIIQEQQQQQYQQQDNLQSFQQQSYLKAIRSSISNPKKSTNQSIIIIKDKSKRLFGDRSKSVMESYRDKDKEKTERDKQLNQGEGQISYLQKINDLLAKNREILAAPQQQQNISYENQDKKNNNNIISKINLNSQLQTIPILFPTKNNNNNNQHKNANNNKSCLILSTVGAVPVVVDQRFVRLPQTRGFLKSQEGISKENNNIKVNQVIQIQKSVLKNRQEEKFQKQQEFSRIVLESIQQSKNPIERIQQLKGIIQQQFSMKQDRELQNNSIQQKRNQEMSGQERNDYQAAFFRELRENKTQSLDKQEEQNLTKVPGFVTPEIQQISSLFIKKSDDYSQVSLEQIKNQRLMSSCFQIKTQGATKQIPVIKQFQKRYETNNGDNVFSNSMLQRRNQGYF